MSGEIKHECGIPLYANSQSDEFPKKEEIEADLHKRTRELFPEKPEDYIPTAIEVVERLAKMAEEAGVKIEH